jgi:hypothetical protein
MTCSGIYQTSKSEIENIRIILQSAYERRNQLVNLNNQFTGIISAIIIGTISFLGTAYFTSDDPMKFYAVILTANLIIVVLLFWRFYAHIIDDDIAKTYKQIIFCESKLNIPSEVELLRDIEKSLKLSDNQLYCIQDIDTKISVINELINNHRIGYRYHKLLDLIASGICILAYLYELYFVLVTSPPLDFTYFISWFIGIPIAYMIFLLGLWWDLFPRIPIQRDPKREEITSIISSIIASKKEKNS